MKNLSLGTAALVLLLVAARPLMAEPPLPASESTHIPSLSAEQWRQDLEFMAVEMARRHKNLYHTVSREAFQTAVDNLHARIPEFQRNQIVVEMMRIAAMVGDGHTRVDPRKDPEFAFPSLPLKLYLFADGIHIWAAKPGYVDLVGAKVEAIGDVPIEEAIRRVVEISSRDNEIGPRLYIPLYLNMPDILNALGMSDSRNAAVLRLRKDGRVWSATVPAGEVDALWPPDTDISLVTPPGWVDARGAASQPLWLQAPFEYHRLIELPERNAIYAQLNMVTDIPGQSLEEFSREIGDRARATNPQALILDLRLNLGGNGNLRTELVKQFIKADDADTRLFVLTWRGSFSATQFILNDLDRLTDAVFIGEPASSKPSSYSDAYRMSLPNSGIDFRVSIAWWQDEQNMDPWTWVDIAAPLTFADYATGQDPALEAALSYHPEPPLSEQLTAAAQIGGVKAVRKAIETYRNAPLKRYADHEGELTAAAITLIRGQFPQEALATAEAVTRVAPESAEAFSLYAQVAERAGHLNIARQAGLRALALDPNHRIVRSLLDRLAVADS